MPRGRRARLAFALLLAAQVAIGAQNPRPAGSISGRVTDADTGAPLADVNVGSREVGWFPTDADGQFTISPLPDGRHSLGILGWLISVGIEPPRLVSVENRRAVTGINFRVRLHGDISGRVIDDQGAPVAHATVLAISSVLDVAGHVSAAQAYANSDLTLRVAGRATTDRQGRYTVTRVIAGLPYRVLAFVPRRYAPPVSDAPADPVLRATSLVAAFHPASESLDAAASVFVHSYETTSGVDIRMRRAPSRCLEATLSHAGVPGPLLFMLEEAEPSRIERPYARSVGFADDKGRIRLCDLYAGRFALTAIADPGRVTPGAFLDRVSVPIEIKDADVVGLTVSSKPPVTVVGQVLWTGSIPTGARLSLVIQTSPTTGTWEPARGDFTFSVAPAVPHSLLLSGLNYRHYVRDVTYGTAAGSDTSIMQTALIPGEGGTTGRLRVVIAADGGAIAGLVRSGDGLPVQNAMVLAWPVRAETDAAIAAGLVVGFTSDQGVFETGALRPGGYRVLATSDPPPFWLHLSGYVPNLYKTPETIGRLRTLAPQIQEVTVEPNGKSQVVLSPVRLQ